MEKNKSIVISDCDGCLTDGKFIYTVDGKVAKVYGPHDNDGVKLLKKNGFDVIFISADKRGFEITKKRINDMGCELYYVPESQRKQFVEDYIKDYTYSIFFGDGISDIEAGECATEFFCPENARREVKDVADYITESKGGEGAFLDLALVALDNNIHIYGNSIKPY